MIKPSRCPSRETTAAAPSRAMIHRDNDPLHWIRRVRPGYLFAGMHDLADRDAQIPAKLAGGMAFGKVSMIQVPNLHDRECQRVAECRGDGGAGCGREIVRIGLQRAPKRRAQCPFASPAPNSGCQERQSTAIPVRAARARGATTEVWCHFQKSTTGSPGVQIPTSPCRAFHGVEEGRWSAGTAECRGQLCATKPDLPKPVTITFRDVQQFDGLAELIVEAGGRKPNGIGFRFPWMRQRPAESDQT